MSVVLSHSSPEASKTIGSIPMELVERILFFASDSSEHETDEIRHNEIVSPSELYELNPKDLLNRLLGTPLYIQRFYQNNLAVHVADHIGDVNCTNKIIDIEEFVLNNCSPKEFTVTCKSQHYIENQTIVDLQVSYNAPPDLLSEIKDKDIVFYKRNVLRGHIGVVIPSKSNYCDYELWYPGRCRPSRQFMRNQWENELKYGQFVKVKYSTGLWEQAAKRFQEAQKRRANSMSRKVCMVTENILSYLNMVNENNSQVIVIKMNENIVNKPFLGIFRSNYV